MRGVLISAGCIGSLLMLVGEAIDLDLLTVPLSSYGMIEMRPTLGPLVSFAGWAMTAVSLSALMLLEWPPAGGQGKGK